MVIPLLIPAVLVYSVFFVWPALQALWLSLHQWNGFQADRVFIGLGNFATMRDDPTFWIALKNTLTITFAGGAVIFLLVFLFAAALQRDLPGKKFFRTLIFFPVIVPGVGIGLIWQFIYNDDWGPLSSGLRAIGLGELTRSWLAPENIISSMTVAVIWTFVGYYLVILLAGIEKIPPTYYEAARLDGAGDWRIFWSVTVPMVWDVLVTAIVLWIISALKIFDIILATTYPSPPRDSYTLTVFVWERAVGMYNPVFQLGYATALGVVLLVLVIVSVSLVRLIMHRESLEY
ncbi:MAG: sugar ABC transporter permease [Propionicimonas sp.]